MTSSNRVHTDFPADTTIVRRGAGLIEAEVDGEIIGLHIENGMCYAFNATATRIWKLLEAPKSIAQLSDALTAEFAIDAIECERELRALLVDLASDGIVSTSVA